MYSRGTMIRSNLRSALTIGLLAFGAASCRHGSPLSTEEIVGEWRKTENTLPPINLLISSEGVGLRATLRLSGAESRGRVRVEGRHLNVKFDDGRADLDGDFVTKTELDLRPGRNGEVYRLRKRP